MNCIDCKGMGLCGRAVCPVLRRLEEMAHLPGIGERLSGMSPPEVFVGRGGYPLIRAGPAIPAIDVGAGQATGMNIGMDIGEIIRARSSLVRSETRIGVREAEAPGRLLEAVQQIALSTDAVGAEVSFTRPPQKRIHFDGVLSPTGPSGKMKSLEITTNPVIPRRVDSIADDREISASNAVLELYDSGIEAGHISRMMSLGLLGARKRRLVPTRWAITASDDLIGKGLKERLLDMPQQHGFSMYSAEVLGNHFEILLMPGPFSFELIEIWMAKTAWSEEGFIGADREDARPRKGYSKLSGGYYAARLAALEHLAAKGRQARILAVREVSEAYWAPLGVWVVREVARAAMNSKPRRSDSLDEALALLTARLKTPALEWMSLAQSLKRPAQRSLIDF